MPRTIKNKQIISRCEELIESLYQNKDSRSVIGSILISNQPHKPTYVDCKVTKRTYSEAIINPSRYTQKNNHAKDIRTFFEKFLTVNRFVNTPKEANSVILIDQTINI